MVDDIGVKTLEAIMKELEEIINFSESLYSKGIKSKDALHVACTVYSSCKYFITTDRKLLKLKIKDIKICSPIDFIIEMEG